MQTLGLASLQGAYEASPTPVEVLMAAAFPVAWIEPTPSNAAVTVGQVIVRDDGGNGQAGDGIAQDYAIMNDAGARVSAFRVSTEWSNAARGSEASETIFMIRIAGALLEGLRFRASGIDTQIVSPFAFILSPNADNTSGLRISTVANDVYIVPQVSTDEFFLGNTIADPSVDLNRGNSRAFDIIPLGTVITALGGGGGNWMNFGSNVVMDYVNATVSGLVAFSGEMRFRQAGNGAGAGNLFKMQGVFTNEIGSSVSIGSQYTFVHVGIYRADGTGGVYAQGNLFHRLSLHQPRWDTVGGATMTLVSVNTGGYINPNIGAGVTVTNMRDWEWALGIINGTVVDRAGLYFPNIAGGTSSTAILRSLMAASATRRFINHTGTAQSDFGGPIALGAGAIIDVILSRGAANRLDLASGDSFNIIGGDFTHTGTNFGIHGSSAPQSAAYTVNNPTTLRTIDVAAGTLTDALQFLGTLAADLAAKGFIG